MNESQVLENLQELKSAVSETQRSLIQLGKAVATQATSSGEVIEGLMNDTVDAMKVVVKALEDRIELLERRVAKLENER